MALFLVPSVLFQINSLAVWEEYRYDSGVNCQLLLLTTPLNLEHISVPGVILQMPELDALSPATESSVSKA